MAPSVPPLHPNTCVISTYFSERASQEQASSKLLLFFRHGLVFKALKKHIKTKHSRNVHVE